MLRAFRLTAAPSALQAGHRTAAGFPHPRHRHQQAERVLVDLQGTSGPPRPGPAAAFTQALHPAGAVHLHLLCTTPAHFPCNFPTVTASVCQQIALKCADVCNPCRVWELSRQWSERVCEEFYRQGEERSC